MQVSMNELRDAVLLGPPPSPDVHGIVGAIVGDRRGERWTICHPCATRLVGRGLGYWIDRNIFAGDEIGDASCVVCTAALKGGER